MTTTVSEVYLLNVASNDMEVAQIWDAITEQQLVDWEREWRR